MFPFLKSLVSDSLSISRSLSLLVVFWKAFSLLRGAALGLLFALPRGRGTETEQVQGFKRFSKHKGFVGASVSLNSKPLNAKLLKPLNPKPLKPYIKPKPLKP